MIIKLIKYAILISGMLAIFSVNTAVGIPGRVKPPAPPVVAPMPTTLPAAEPETAAHEPYVGRSIEYAYSFLDPAAPIEPLTKTFHTRDAGVASARDFTFTLHGFIGESYSSGNFIIYAVEITGDGFYQLIDTFETQLNEYMMNRFFVLEDWNRDGYIDFQLHKYEGGTMHNEPSCFFLWDKARGMFVQNAELEDISETASVHFVDGDDRIRAYSRFGWAANYTDYYRFVGDELFNVGWQEVEYEIMGDDIYVTEREFEVIGDEVVLVSENSWIEQ